MFIIIIIISYNFQGPHSSVCIHVGFFITATANVLPTQQLFLASLILKHTHYSLPRVPSLHKIQQQSYENNLIVK